MKIQVLGHMLTVVLSDPGDWTDAGMGRCNNLTNTITLRGDLPIDSLRATLLHEITHFISDTLDLELTEHQVTNISIGFHTILPNLALAYDNDFPWDKFQE